MMDPISNKRLLKIAEFLKKYWKVGDGIKCVGNGCFMRELQLLSVEI